MAPSQHPLIGVTGRRWPVAALGDRFPVGYRDASFDLHIADYSAALAAAGGLPVQLSPDADPAALVGRLDGIVFSGGADLDPARYGTSPEPALGPIEPRRDAFELALLEAAAEVETPVLGICRGLQLLNVWAGGTLCQHLERHQGDGHPRFEDDRRAPGHTVRFVAGTLAARLFGPEATVNSLHHQRVEQVGPGLTASGRSPDGTVEALEHDRLPILSVQWHPEAMGPSDPALGWIVDAARRRGR